MENRFIKLTEDSDKKPIIIGVNHISWAQENGTGGTDIHMSYARGKDLYPKSIKVKESFDLVTRLLNI